MKLNQARFLQACEALKNAWEEAVDSGDVFGIYAGDHGVSVQMQWGAMRELFPDTRVAFFQRERGEYPWEARIAVGGVVALALLTDAQRDATTDKTTSEEAS